MTTNDVSIFFFLNPWKEAADTGNIRFGLLVSTVEQDLFQQWHKCVLLFKSLSLDQCAQ